MAVTGFLRKRATLSRNQSVKQPEPYRCSGDDVPPTLPPLLLSLSLSDPDPAASAPPPALPPAASPPVLALPSPPPEFLSLDDVWDPWASTRLLDSPTATPQLPLKPPVRHAPDAVCNIPTPPPTSVAKTSRQDHATVQSVLHPARPKSAVHSNHRPPLIQNKRPSSSGRTTMNSSTPAVVRGQATAPSDFDFEESLSAANVPSVVNQFRSYPSPPIRHHTSPAPPSQAPHTGAQHPPLSTSHRHHTPPQKPGSSSSLSSSSHHTDATRRTNGSYTSTSASSVASPPEVIDVSTAPSAGRLDSHSVRKIPNNTFRANPFINSQPFLANATTHSPSIPRARVGRSASALPSRTFMSFNANAKVHRSPTGPSVPPTSFPDRVQPLARPSSHATVSSSSGPANQSSMLYDILRSGNPDVVAPLRKGPLIFAAMSGSAQPANNNPYPSPPAEYASLETSPPSRRKASISSGFRNQFDGPASHPTELSSLRHKSSKGSLAHVASGSERPQLFGIRGDASSVAEHSRPRVLTKARPTTPQKPFISSSHKVIPAPGDPLLLDDDPFARVQGVKMLKPSRSCSRSVASTISKEDGLSSEDGHLQSSSMTPPTSSSDNAPLTPPDDYKVARQQRRGQWLEKIPPPAVVGIVAKLEEEQVEEPPREPTPPPTYFPIVSFLSNIRLLPLLLSFLSYSEWLALYSANKQVRELFKSRILREFVLERYLGTVGYSKWDYEWAEPLELSLKDLHNYLRGVAMPVHHYARLSAAYLQPNGPNRTAETPDILTLALTTRAYTRVVLRLRTQAESEARYLKTLQSIEPAQPRNNTHPGTRQPSVSSRAPSPTTSNSHSHNHSNEKAERNNSFSSQVSKFRSPLYRIGRAPVLRVFVPSPEGDWLSDASVVECEAELKRSSVLKLLRVGDIVWDVAVGDEGNQGRLIWDGSYLVDLDYRYSRVGELSPYFHSLAFSPSYFHRVIRIGGSASHNPHCNPIVYIDISPWGREIAANLQLLQDRARTETAHGALHDVVRWVHRSQFTIRPPAESSSHGQNRIRSSPRGPVRIPIPTVDGFYIDPGWYGTVVLESEGTNEGLVDLQSRCGPGVFPPRAESLATKIRNEKEKENRRVWRILREKSRPGEIWLRAVQVKERLM